MSWARAHGDDEVRGGRKRRSRVGAAREPVASPVERQRENREREHNRRNCEAQTQRRPREALEHLRAAVTDIVATPKYCTIQTVELNREELLKEPWKITRNVRIGLLTFYFPPDSSVGG